MNKQCIKHTHTQEVYDTAKTELPKYGRALPRSVSLPAPRNPNNRLEVPRNLGRNILRLPQLPMTTLFFLGLYTLS